jgi:endoglucanase
MKFKFNSFLSIVLVILIFLTSCNSNNQKNITKVGVEETGKFTIPILNLDSFDIPQNDGLKMVKNMKIGWNLGNTFDAVDCDEFIADKLDYESAWSGVKTTSEMIKMVKDAGFNTIRIPVSWHNHVNEDYKIDKAWLKRVNEVVDYCISSGLYVIINIHHDIDKKYIYPSTKYKESSLKYIEVIWEQLSEKFKKYDEKLIFEAINEPRLVNTNFEWWLDVNNQDCIDAVEMINLYNQRFVDVVRKSGRNNTKRYLMVPSYAASPEYALNDLFKLPNDISKNNNKIILSVHAYTPYNFALQSHKEGGSVSNFSIDNAQSTKDIDDFLDRLYQKFILNGVPIIIGEFGARDKMFNLKDRVDYSSYYVSSAMARGITCCWWDNNAFFGNGENFGLLDRKTLEWKYPDIVVALMENTK